MAAKIPNVALTASLEQIRTHLLEGSTLRLFEGATVPAAGDTLSTYTAIETAFGGYSAQTLSGWSSSALNGNTAYTNSPFGTFSPSASPGSHTITGYFLVDAAGQLHMAERLAQAITVTASTPFSLVVQRTEASAA